MPSDSSKTIEPFVPEGDYGTGLLEILLRAGLARSAPARVTTAVVEEPKRQSKGLETGTTLGVTCYRSGITERINSVVAYQMLCVFIDSMRLFIRDSLPLLIGAGSDEQILKAIRRSDDRHDLQRTIHEKGRGCAIDAIDTVHFPQIISKYWGSFEKQLGDRTEVLKLLSDVHHVRNAVSHPAPRDLGYAHADRCRRAIDTILARTGPPESCGLVGEIWERAYGCPQDNEADLALNSELQIVVDNINLAASDVSELILDIRNQQLTVVSERKPTTPRSVLRNLRIRIRRLTRTRTRTRRRHRP